MEMKRFLKVIGISFIMMLLYTFAYDVGRIDHIIIFSLLMLIVDRFILRSENKEVAVKSIELEVDLNEEQAMEFVKQWDEWMKERDVTIHKGEQVITKDKTP